MEHGDQATSNSFDIDLSEYYFGIFKHALLQIILVVIGLHERPDVNRHNHNTEFKITFTSACYIQYLQYNIAKAKTYLGYINTHCL